ncbi:MAG: esterase-like activity of phytase family protein [Sulfurimonas sp.]|nr:esterase-like activity of phytase family protein [Sulfurimonas sp.]
MSIIIKFFLTMIAIVYSLNAQLYTHSIKPQSLKSDKLMNIKILDTVAVKFDDFNGIEFHEISALAYQKNKLYALSDRGYLYHLNIKIKKNRIKSLKLVKALELKRKNSKRLKKKHRDAEGMVLVDEELYISFERKPRVDVFSLNGKKIKKYEIQKELNNIDNYQTKNKALESIAYSKKHGIVTAPEIPLLGNDENLHVVYAKNKQYKFRATSKLSAMEFIDENRLLTLERSFNVLTRQRVVTLNEIDLRKSHNEISRARLLAVMSSDDGWNLDNFEGLTKVGKNKFLMVSDDSGGYFDKTVFVLFKVLRD